MEDISRHISDLLFEHDCVIVPSLGGFLASNQPSRILHPNNIIYPPYRRIAFNVYLRQNDGLLTNYIADSKSLSYPEASELLDSFTANCFDTLDNGKKVNLSEVGTLFYDKEKNIQFEAFRNFNHLKDSFGMEAINFIPLQKTKSAEKKIAVGKIRPSIAIEKNLRKPVAFNKKFIGIAAILTVLIWLSFNLYMVAPKHYESTSLSPFDSQNIIINTIDSIRNCTPELNKDSEEITSGNTFISEDTLASAEINPSNPSPEENENVVTKITDTVRYNPPVSKPAIPEAEFQSPGRHYIIAGVFKVRENAESMLLHLKQLGFNNAEIIPANNCNYVSYEAYTFQDKALSKVDSLHKNNLDGWIWKH